MAVVRQYWRDTTTEPGTNAAGTPPTYDLSDTQGSPITTLTATTNSTTSVVTLQWQKEVGTSVTGTSFPYSFVINQVGSVTMRFRLQRVNSAGVVQASSAYSSEYTTTGTHTGTVTFSTTWATGDWLRVSFEHFVTGGHGNQTVGVETQNASTYIDADITVAGTTYDGTGTDTSTATESGVGEQALDATGSDTSTATESGGSEIVAGPITHEATGASSASTAGNSSADSGNTAWPESDVTVGGWTTSPLWSKVNTGLSPDTEFIGSDNGSLASELQLTPVATPSDGVSIFVRARNVTSGNLEVRLVEGTTVRATHTISTLTAAFAEYEVVLTSAEVGSVTDWTNVRVRLTAVAP